MGFLSPILWFHLGIVTFLSTPKCSFIPNDGQKYLLHRYVKLWIPRSQEDPNDSSDGEEIILKISPNSRLDIWERLSNFQICLVCNVKPKSFRTSSSANHGRFYLQSTSTTRIFCGARENFPDFAGYEVLEKWQAQPPFTPSDSLEDQLILEPSFDPLYPVAEDAASFTRAFPDINLVRFSDISHIFSSLRVSEERSVLIQGSILTFYHIVSKKNRRSQRVRRRRGGSKKGAQSQADANVDAILLKESRYIAYGKDPDENAEYFPAELTDLNRELKILVDFAIPPHSYPRITADGNILSALTPEEEESPWLSFFPGFPMLPKDVSRLIKGEITPSTEVLQSQKFIFVAHLNKMKQDDERIIVTNCFKLP